MVKRIESSINWTDVEFMVERACDTDISGLICIVDTSNVYPVYHCLGFSRKETSILFASDRDIEYIEDLCSTLRIKLSLPYVGKREIQYANPKYKNIIGYMVD